ncbi:MAG: SWIM zinc finger family protein [Devosia sp.]|nr:SWIM zinc finger family protein [Devosia sp.]
MFNEDSLRDAAGEAAFSRGKAYWRDGRVRFTSTAGPEIRATVAGTETYRVKLTKTRAGLTGSCSCPAFEDMPVCKHMVAVALAANALPEGSTGDSGEGDPVAAYLNSLPHERLVAMIRDFAERFPEIDRSLGLAASNLVKDDRAVLARFRGALDDAIAIDDYVDYAEASGWAANVAEVLDAIALLVDDGRAGIAMTLVEEAIEDLGPALNMIDDSNGEIGGLIHRCREIHALAAAKVRPDAQEFAARLVEMALEHDLFEASEIVPVYGDILGEAGLAEVERLALRGLDLLPPLKHGATVSRDPDSSQRWSLTRLADDCAARRGDVDARIAVRKRDLGHAYDYLGVVDMLVAAGRDADALVWAREGLFVFEDVPDDRLVAAALPLFERAGLQAEAEQLVWNSFTAKPSRALFDKLMERPLRADDGEASRRDTAGKAIAHLQRRLDRTGSRDPRRWHDAELLIDLLTGQAHHAEAWEAVDRFKLPGMAGVVRSLIEASLDTHPDRAMRIWRQQIEELVSMGGNRNYETAHQLLARLADIAAKSGTADDHSDYVADLRVRHKPKRNFMKLF